MLRAILVICAVLLMPRVAAAHEGTGNPHQDLYVVNNHVENAIAALRSGDAEQARAEYARFDDEWFEIEDGIRDLSRQSYRDIEDAMSDVRFALNQQPVDPLKAQAALEALVAANDAFIDTAGTAITSGGQDAAPSTLTLGGVLPKLDEALEALARGDLAYASAEVEEFRALWPDVEGVVAANDGAVYRRAEELQAQASAELKAGAAQQAVATLTELKTALQPFAQATLTYGMFDATSILLREGLEALLIIAALLAFLQKSGNADKRRWIWIGGAAGVIASLLAAIAIQQLFSSLITGANRELIEGITGLVAAALLFYVSYWLHSKTHLGGWQRYIKDKTSAALATGSLFSLASLAFLSVFREGAETALFYIGIAPAIALRDLLLGLGLGTAILIVIGVVMIGLGKHLPLKLFFQITSVLIWYLGFKFIGSGIRALQIARVVPETTASWLPSSEVLGLYPTWETTLPQMALVALAIGVVLWMRSLVREADRLNVPAKTSRNL
ncbi:MAG TPA: FTR1 family protein [Herpetosiphonaceae bacterium]